MRWTAFLLVVIACQAFASGDHHMHVHSETGGASWAAMCAAMPGECSEAELVPLPPEGAAMAVAALDEAGLDRGVIVSLAYFYGAPWLADTEFNDARHVRAENRYAIEQAGLYPSRLVGFISVNPLADYALDEVRYWVASGEIAGLKLHLANAAFDFSNAAHVGKLRAVINVLNEYQLPTVLHLRNRGDGFGYADVAVFIDEIAVYAPDVTFQLAHLAGWGGYDAGNDESVQAFLDAFEDGKLDRSKFWFELSSVVEADMTQDVLDRLQERFRDIGFDRLLFGSDWSVEQPLGYLAVLEERLDLTDAEWDQLMDNEAPYLPD